MCGIAGIVSVNTNDVTLDRVKKMTDSISHRGPDGEGHWISDDGRVALGHRRLSIIDLSEHANQPMHFAERYTIVFNGEIYNYIELRESLKKEGYVFRTSSDTEVLMALYDRDKENCLQWLDGMFAFAVYDSKEHKLFCARDRFGEKPFHYHLQEGKSFLFGSEMKELWAAGLDRKYNHAMLFNYLQSGYNQNPQSVSDTFFSNIQRLEHSHYLIIDTCTLKVVKKKYWDIDLANQSDISFETATDRFKELFLQSVSRRLRSDVPVGSSLSGGLDSSAVVCAIDLLNSDKTIHQKTFSAQFPGFEKDESYYQQLVIDQTHADAYFTFPNADTMLNELDKVFWHQEEPFGSASILAQYEVFKLAKQQQVTVMLDGQGADEILAGYHFYYQYFFLELEKQKGLFSSQWKEYIQLHADNPVNPLFRKDIKYKLRQQFPSLFTLLRTGKKMLKRNNGFFTDDFYAQEGKNEYSPVSHFTSLNGMLRQSCLGGGLQELLRYADRNSMAHSREVRLPFLSHELVEFVFSLPATFKMNNGWTKYVMRKSLETTLPKEITWRKDKIGYEPPQKKWLQSPEVKEIIQESRRTLVSEGILNNQILNKPVMPGGSLEKGDNSWGVWMAAKLINS
jgi:asparagine synthase (glutamine-hydrolysing)